MQSQDEDSDEFDEYNEDDDDDEYEGGDDDEYDDNELGMDVGMVRPTSMDNGVGTNVAAEFLGATPSAFETAALERRMRTPMGTPLFRAPELLGSLLGSPFPETSAECPKVSEAADIWGLGATLYMMVSSSLVMD